MAGFINHIKSPFLLNMVCAISHNGWIHTKLSNMQSEIPELHVVLPEVIQIS